MKNQPNPGSDEAIEQGCTCPVLDNGYGKGAGYPDCFWISTDCKLHSFGREGLFLFEDKELKE